MAAMKTTSPSKCTTTFFAFFIIPYFSIFTDKVSSTESILCIFLTRWLLILVPAMLCHTAANTLGSAAAGPKCAVASATLNLNFAFYFYWK